MNFGPDDLNFTVAKTIYLLDMKTRTFKMRYFNGRIPQDMKRIFCTNLVPPERRTANTPFSQLRDQFGDEVGDAPPEPWIFPRSTNEQQKIAINRRYRIAGPVERMLATPVSSWERLVVQWITRKKPPCRTPMSRTWTTKTSPNHPSRLSYFRPRANTVRKAGFRHQSPVSHSASFF